MNKQRRLAIEKMAENIRDECKIIGYGLPNIFEAAEKVDYRVIRYPIGSNSFLGFAMIKDAERIIFSNSSLILSREIFTVAHEIGHHKLHLTQMDRMIIRDDDFDDRDETEVEANYFAACLLMPFEKVEKYVRLELSDKKIVDWNGLDIARLQTTFNVSFDMVLIRLKALGILDQCGFEKLKFEKTEKTATKLLNVINGNVDLCRPVEAKRVPAEYLEWVISNYNDKLIPIKSLEVALNYVDLNVEDFENPEDESEGNESLEDLLKGMD